MPILMCKTDGRTVKTVLITGPPFLLAWEFFVRFFSPHARKPSPLPFLFALGRTGNPGNIFIKMLPEEEEKHTFSLSWFSSLKVVTLCPRSGFKSVFCQPSEKKDLLPRKKWTFYWSWTCLCILKEKFGRGNWKKLSQVEGENFAVWSQKFLPNFFSCIQHLLLLLSRKFLSDWKISFFFSATPTFVSQFSEAIKEGGGHSHSWSDDIFDKSDFLLHFATPLFLHEKSLRVSWTIVLQNPLVSLLFGAICSFLYNGSFCLRLHI